MELLASMLMETKHNLAVWSVKVEIKYVLFCVGKLGRPFLVVINQVQ